MGHRQEVGRWVIRVVRAPLGGKQEWARSRQVWAVYSASWLSGLLANFNLSLCI